MKFKEETTVGLSFLDYNGDKYDPDRILLSNDYVDDIEVITSDNRLARIVGVRRTRIGAAGAGTSIEVVLQVDIVPTSEPITNLYENVKLARSFITKWAQRYTSAGKKAPKIKKEIAESIICQMITSEAGYLEVLNEGVEDYLKSNLDIT